MKITRWKAQNLHPDVESSKKDEQSRLSWQKGRSPSPQTAGETVRDCARNTKRKDSVSALREARGQKSQLLQSSCTDQDKQKAVSGASLSPPKSCRVLSSAKVTLLCSSFMVKNERIIHRALHEVSCSVSSTGKIMHHVQCPPGTA